MSLDLAARFRSLVAEGRTGFLLQPDGQLVEQAAGYVVAISPSTNDLDLVIATLEPGQLLGYWHDGTTGFVDRVVVYQGRATADLAARAHDQVAVYDLGQGAVVMVDRPEVPLPPVPRLGEALGWT